MKLEKILQDPDNPILMRLGNRDYDMNAISLIRSGTTVDAEDVEKCIQHLISFLHRDVDGRTMTSIGKMKVPSFLHGLCSTDEKTVEYVNYKLGMLAKTIRSFDSKTYGKILVHGGLKEKYHLKKDFSVTKKTSELVNSCELGFIDRKKEEEKCECPECKEEKK